MTDEPVPDEAPRRPRTAQIPANPAVAGGVYLWRNPRVVTTLPEDAKKTGGKT